MKNNITQQCDKWLSQQLEDRDLRRELEDIKSNEEDLEDRFYKDLEFGTGGLRGIIGVGTNRMNIYTVSKATQGYANYLIKNFPNPSVAIAHDSRIKSDTFAEVAAEVFAANGIKVYTYRELMPTPSLSFAVRHLQCSGGVVITASHNPAKYNGYKVYGSDGCQITTKAAKEIQEEINQVDIFQDVKKLEFNQGLATGIISYIGEDTIDAFIHGVSKESLCPPDINKDISIVYTPLNGAGRYCVTRVLQENGFTNISVVKEQEQPDGNFTTCPYPNPEIKEALGLGLEYAKRLGSDLLLATDPDCDRVGTAVKSEDGYVLLSGNEMGMLLLDYICKRRIAMGIMPEKPIVVKTIVTIDMAKRIAADYGVEVIDVLTGFKFIGEQIGILEEKGEADRYIFGFEESYGYLSGGYVRDKDAVDGSLLICEMFAYYKAQGKSLLEVMCDYLESIAFDRNGKQEPIHLPKSDVLKFILEGNASVVVRPSGTEPKLKMYLSVSAEGKEEAARLEALIAEEIETTRFL